MTAHWYIVEKGNFKKTFFGNVMLDGTFKLADGRYIQNKEGKRVTEKDGFTFTKKQEIKIKRMSADERELLEDQDIDIRNYRDIMSEHADYK